MAHSSRLLPLTLAFFGALCAPLVAQDAPPAEKPKAITTADPTIGVSHLELLLEPLTKAELEVEAKGWQDLVKASVQELSKLYIESEKRSAQEDAAAAEGTKEPDEVEAAKLDEAKKQTNDQVAEVQDVKTSRLKRFDTVLTALEKKGGDAAGFRTYATAVSGIKVNTGDAGARVSAVSGWLKSEEGGIKWAYGALKLVVIFIVFWIIATIVARVVRSITERHLKWSALLERFINKLVRRVIMLIGLLVALSTIGVNVGAMLALIGGGAFIIGFALQDTLGNFAAGLMLLIYRPFDVGDFVETAGVMGTVDNVSLVSTSIRTPDNKLILVPNKNVWGQVITNATASAERRVDMVFGIGYGDDIAKAQKILEDIIAKHEMVLREPAPVIKVNELAASSVNFICRPWSKTADYWDVYWDVTRKVKEEFDANGISIPFPQQDVHIHQAPAAQD